MRPHDLGTPVARYPTRHGDAWVWLLVAAGVGLVAYTVNQPGLPRDGIYVAFGVAAVVAIELGVRTNRPARPWAWHLMAAGTLLWSAGDAVGSWSAHVLGTSPFPGAPDALYLAGYVVMAAALLVLVRGRRPRRDRPGLLDSTIVTVSLALLTWVLLARPTADGYRTAPLATVVALLYPLADLLLVGGLVRLVTTPGGRSRSFRLLVLAVGLLVSADVAQNALHLRSWDASGHLDLLWLASYAVWGAAALEPSMASLTEPVRDEPVRFSRARLGVLGVAVLVAPGVLAVEAALGHRLDVWAVVVGSVAVFGLVLARMKLSIDQIQEANTEREAARVALAHQAAHDSLTGLPNRAQAMTLVAGALSRAQRTGAVVGLLFIDLDGFKQVNDTLGHAAGDEVLRTAGQRMRACVRDGDVVARLGGDEFVVLLEPLDEEHSAVGVAERVVAALSEPVVLPNGREIGIGASVGVAVSQDGGVDPERLLHEADVAVYRAKTGGRGRSEVFDRSLREELERRSRLQTGLRKAIEDDALLLRHEPLVDLRTRRLVGYEALVTWPRPGADELVRDQLVPVAERSELVCDLDTWALREAVQQVASTPPPSRPTLLTVPLSRRHLQGGRVLHDVTGALEEAGLPPERLMVVVSEADLDEDDPRLLTNLSRLRALGVRVCVDGFGTREGPTDRWSQLPVDRVRIDPVGLARGALRTSMLLRLTVETAHTFGWEVVAGGVRENDQLLALAEIGCEYAQGPIPRRTILALDRAA